LQEEAVVLAQHILVPVDFSAPSMQALVYARELASKLLARVTLLHVIQTPLLGGEPTAGMGMAYADLMAQMEADVSQTMADCVERLREGGLECDSLIIHGAPFEQIVEAARARQVDLIVMATHGHTGLQRFLLGSVAEKVVRLAPCPVLVTRSGEEQDNT
jgi:nucleotide-binding universal stress UspA family protein